MAHFGLPYLMHGFMGITQFPIKREGKLPSNPNEVSHLDYFFPLDTFRRSRATRATSSHFELVSLWWQKVSEEGTSLISHSAAEYSKGREDN